MSRLPLTVNSQPWPKGHATRTTYPSRDAKGEQPTNLQPWPLATLREQPSTFNLKQLTIP
ncbi:MAG: hypothetical protein F6J98_08675 [Moorea sp. SIO4G2]|uniref:hypothetical protein n=1 Tax=Moorena bouillonii TaxID=207920 RepID=UPI00117D4704|nr:hypothetical protein [Moorena bouillonii]NEO60498.1 hypothetical protein [Moorena sp. SIO4G2]